MLQLQRAGKKKNQISSETIILLPNVQIFANNCPSPAGVLCLILLAWFLTEGIL